MNYLSVCSGIEAASAAWGPLGWKAVAFSEIEPFPCAVLAHHYPCIPNWGNMEKYKDWPDADVAVLVGGTPCQSFSVAGLRKGLADPRGNLALVYLGIAERYRPRWLVWENVPGVLSSGGGRDFGAFIGALVELGYSCAWRVLDAQYYGVPQRRRRVFVVGYSGGWAGPAAVLFERESMCGNHPPRRQAGESVAPAVTSGAANGSRAHGARSGSSKEGLIVPSGGGDEAGLTARCLTGSNQRIDAETETLVVHSLRGEGFDASEDGTGRGTPLVPVCFSAKDYGADARVDAAPTLRAGSHDNSHANEGCALAVATLAIRGRGEDSNIEYRTDGTANALLTPNGGRAGIGVGAVQYGEAVRRLTPRECERLQGFRDDYTLIRLSGAQRRAVDAEMAAYYRRTNQVFTDAELRRLAADGPRYKALGNSMAVPVMRWLGDRLMFADHFLHGG